MVYELFLNSVSKVYLDLISRLMNKMIVSSLSDYKKEKTKCNIELDLQTFLLCILGLVELIFCKNIQ